MDKLLSPKLFISYAREDAQTDLVVGFLRRLRKALGDSYITSVYIDTEDMEMGEDCGNRQAKLSRIVTI